MQLASLRCSLAQAQVREIPDVQGVFRLWDGQECVYVGHTPWNMSLRDCLREPLALSVQGVISASHFTWETTPLPKTRESELLALFEEKNGRLPRYNRDDSPLRPPQSCITDLRSRR